MLCSSCKTLYHVLSDSHVIWGLGRFLILWGGAGGGGRGGGVDMGMGIAYSVRRQSPDSRSVVVGTFI